MFEDRLVVIDSYGVNFSGKVLFCEEGIGLTVVNVLDETEFYLCINCKGSPRFEEMTNGGDGVYEELVFQYAVRCIKKNEPIKSSTINEISKSQGKFSGNNPHTGSCAFSS